MRRWKEIGGWGRNHAGGAMDSTEVDGCWGWKRRRLRPLFCSSRDVLGERGSLGWNSVADSLGQDASSVSRRRRRNKRFVARKRSRNVEGELHMKLFFFFEARRGSASWPLSQRVGSRSYSAGPS